MLPTLREWIGSDRSPQLVLVGAAGSGRTRALDDLADDLRRREWTVTALRLSLDDADDPAMAVGALGVPEPGASLDRGRGVLADQLVRAWSAGSGERHLIAIDDVDLLADPILRAVCAACRRVAGRVVLTATSADRLATGLPGARFHQLEPWRPEQIYELVRRTAPHGPIPEVLDRLAALSDGNPGAARALTDSLSGAQLVGFEPLLPVAFGVPLQTLVTSHIGRALRPVALLLACGPGTSPAVLERAGVSLGVPATHLDALERAGLAEHRRGGLCLRPAALGFAVEAVTPTGQRRRTHAALAEAYDGFDDARLVWHRAQAAGEPDAALAAQLERLSDLDPQLGGLGGPAGMGRRSMGSLLVQRASELSVETSERGRRLVVAAEFAWLEGAPARALRLLAEAEDLFSDPDLELRVAYVRGSIDFAAGAERRALRVMVDAVPGALRRLPLLESTALLVRACDAAVTAGDVATAVVLGRHAQSRLEIASGESTVSVRLRLVAGTAKVLAEDFDAGFALVEDVLGDCSQRRDPSHALVGMRAALLAGDTDAMMWSAEQAEDRLRESGNRAMMLFVTARRALAEVLSGRFRSAVDTTLAGVEESALLGQENARAEHLAVQALAYARAGDADESSRSAEEALRLASDFGLAWPGALAMWALGELELGAGDPEKALERLGLLWHGNLFERHPLIATLASGELVEAAARVGRPQEGDVALRRLVMWAGAIGGPAVAGLVERSTALRSTDATVTGASFERALALHREAERPFDEARTALAYGAWLRRERRKSESRQHLWLAHERFESVGANAWRAHAGQEIRASGETALRRQLPTTGVHLTGQELTVSDLVADGESNRQVAEKLSLSVRTVEYHLRNVYLKLGVRNRTELAAKLRLSEVGEVIGPAAGPSS